MRRTLQNQKNPINTLLSIGVTEIVENTPDLPHLPPITLQRDRNTQT